MPYKSEAQRRFFNSPAGKEKIGAEEVEHWNEVSKGKELPEKLSVKDALRKAIRLCDAKRYIFKAKNDFEEYDMSASIRQRLNGFAKIESIKWDKANNSYSINASAKNEGEFLVLVECLEVFDRWLNR